MTILRIFALSSLTIVTGCAREVTPPPAPGPLVSAQALSAAPASAVEALDRMDMRTAVPLLPMMANHQKQNMREHLEAVQQIVSALSSQDFAGVEQAAGRIGFSEQMGKMCTHLGAGAPGFAEQALAFHRTADRIAVAARARDQARVLTELGTTLQACTSCHAAWKQQLVDEPTWQSLTSSAAPMHGTAP